MPPRWPGRDPTRWFLQPRSSTIRHGNSSRKFKSIDSYVHERLAILASDKHGRYGRNWASHYNGAWFRRLGVYTLTGTVRYGTAHA